MPARFRRFETQVVVPLRTIQQIVNPPRTDTTSTSYTAAGVDPAHPDSGLVTRAQLTAGSWFGSEPADQVLVNTAYAAKKGLRVGSTLSIDGTTYTVVGLVAPTLTGNVSDVYFDLGTLQTVASKTDRVNEVLVKVDRSSDVPAVAAAIHDELPGAQVVTAASLAGTVTGSLSDAKNLADHLGAALALLILAGAFVIAALLTLASVGKRVREIGTLRAVGWSRRRVVGQITLETLGIGLLGGVLGLLLGLAIAGTIGLLGPTLTATSPGVGVGASTLSSLFGQSTEPVSRAVALSAPIQLSTVVLGIGVALLGGLVAGAIGGWRAARLSPSTALRDLG
jgi:putative ABC transport system permease protein